MKLKRLISLLLCAVMAVGMVCTAAYADDDLEYDYTFYVTGSTTSDELGEYVGYEGNVHIIVTENMNDTATRLAGSLWATGTKVIEPDPDAVEAGNIYSGPVNKTFVITINGSQGDVNLIIRNLVCKTVSINTENSANSTITLGEGMSGSTSTVAYGTMYLNDNAYVQEVTVSTDGTLYLNDTATVDTLHGNIASGTIVLSGAPTVGLMSFLYTVSPAFQITNSRKLQVQVEHFRAKV